MPELVEEDLAISTPTTNTNHHTLNTATSAISPTNAEHAERAAPTADELVVGQLRHRTTGDDLVLEPFEPAHVVISSITRSAARRAA